MKKVQVPRSIILVVTTYLVAAISASITLQNWEFLKVYIPFFFLAVLVLTYMHQRVRFSDTILWCLTLWGALHFAGGLIQLPNDWPYDGEQKVLYSLWLVENTLKYDQAVHAFGFGSTTWLAWEALRSSIQHRLGRKLYPSMGMIFLCVFTGMGLGALNEIVEFIAVLNVEDTNVGGYLNTSWDLVANCFGCLWAGILILWRG